MLFKCSDKYIEIYFRFEITFYLGETSRYSSIRSYSDVGSQFLCYRCRLGMLVPGMLVLSVEHGLKNSGTIPYKILIFQGEEEPFSAVQKDLSSISMSRISPSYRY